jgi:hypothetical protein
LLATSFTICAPHVLEGLLEVDLLRHRDAVLGDEGRAELLVEDDVSSLGTQGDADGVGQAVHAAQDLLPRLVTVCDLLCHECVSY